MVGAQRRSRVACRVDTRAPAITMHVDPYIVLGSAEGRIPRRNDRRGGGALMTPMLILLFGVNLVGHLERPRGGGDDASGRRRRAPAQGHGPPEPGRLDGPGLGADGVPRRLSAARAGQRQVRPNAHRDRARRSPAAGAAAMVLRYLLDRAAAAARTGAIHDMCRVPYGRVAIGMIGGRDRGHHLRWVGVADDHPAALPVPHDRRQAARRHRPQARRCR